MHNGKQRTKEPLNQQLKKNNERHKNNMIQKRQQQSAVVQNYLQRDGLYSS